MKARHDMRSAEDTEGVRERLPSIICPFCDQRIKSSERLVKCRNCGEVFESELELHEEECDADFF